MKWPALVLALHMFSPLQANEFPSSERAPLVVNCLCSPEKCIFQLVKSLKPGEEYLFRATPQESEELQILQLALRDPRSGCPEEVPVREHTFTLDDYRQGIWALGLEIQHSEISRSIQVYHNPEELRERAIELAKQLHLPLSQDFPEVFAEYAYLNWFDPHAGVVLLPSRTLVFLVAKMESDQ